ncbi:MAG: IS110 family transposase [Hydrogenophaga sp.]|nr:IS110 family transposase [Hydrogenophaga sp.]
MLAVIGLDIAKRYFQLHSVDPETGEITKLKLKRAEMVPFFSNRQPSVVAMEACGSSHHWARQLRALGHEVRLIATKFVKPFVKGNKNDAADARAIWEAAQRPEMRFVPVKTEAQQAILALHTMRDGLVKARTAQLHQLRAVFYELGFALPEGRHWCVKRLPEAFASLENKIPAMAIEAMRDQYQLIVQLSERVDAIERKLEAFKRSDERCERLLQIPGVGLLTATSIVASVGDAKEFSSGREFAAWLGVVPRHSGTGGRVRILGMSKQGNSYLRAMVIHCARAVMARQKEHSPWLERLIRERPWNVAVVALANKIARTIWALLAHERNYTPEVRYSAA